MKLQFRGAALALGLLVAAMPLPLPAQSAGAVEFTAQVAPTGGRPEPVRQLTFYALRKSLEAIRQEAAQADPAPDLEKFVDGLRVSSDLKAWMKKHHSVQLSGTDFVTSLTADEIVDVPEFFDAYVARNSSLEMLGFPKPKFKEKDRTANPDKYKREKEEYKAALRKFITAMPESVRGLDADLGDLNPYPKWAQLQAEQHHRLEYRTLELAQKRYLAAQTDTNLNGHGVFQGLAPGDYWISSLGTPATAGDVRLLWDVHVTVQPGETTRLSLTNLNAAGPYAATSNLDR
jgi:hypothetical protein